MVDSGRARHADQFDIYHHGVSKAYKWKKIGVEKVRPPACQNCDSPRRPSSGVLTHLPPLANHGVIYRWNQLVELYQIPPNTTTI